MTSVSVVIPVFNRESLIESALNSVLSQSIPPSEVVVVDDGSTDQTLALIEAWKMENPNLVVRTIGQSNKGANAARNRGIQEAHSLLVAFLDSDDQWVPEKLEKQVAILKSNVNVGGVYCGTVSMNLDSGQLTPASPRAYPNGNILRSMLIGDVTSPTSCWVVRKSCFDEVGAFDESLPARQDWDMWIRLSSRFDVAAVPENLVIMGEHTGERVRSNEDREIQAHKSIFKKYAHLRKEQAFWVSLAARSAMYRRRGRMYFHKKRRYFSAAGMQVAAILVWPFAFDSYAALVGIILPKGIRQSVHTAWNKLFGKTRFAIKSH